jgi:hypothetical protein
VLRPAAKAEFFGAEGTSPAASHARSILSASSVAAFSRSPDMEPGHVRIAAQLDALSRTSILGLASFRRYRVRRRWGISLCEAARQSLHNQEEQTNQAATSVAA